MQTRRLDEIQDLDNEERVLLGLEAQSFNYVTFRKGHMQVDVKSFVRSRSGQKSVARVIKHSPRKAADDTPPQAL